MAQGATLHQLGPLLRDGEGLLQRAQLLQDLAFARDMKTFFSNAIPYRLLSSAESRVTKAKSLGTRLDLCVQLRARNTSQNRGQCVRLLSSTKIDSRRLSSALLVALLLLSLFDECLARKQQNEVE